MGNQQLNGQEKGCSDCRLTNRTTRGTRLGEALRACLFSFFLGRLSFFAYLCSDKQEARRPAVQERAASHVNRRHGVPPCKEVRVCAAGTHA